MVVLDLRNIGVLFIRTLATKPWPFEMTGGANCPSLIGASATMIISSTTVIQTLTVGSGLTITAANKIAVNGSPLAAGIYSYNFEITPLSGAIIRIQNQIQAE